MKTLNRVLNPSSYRPEVVYDLDSLLLDTEQSHSIRMVDLETISQQQAKSDAPLEFESRFESGNLRRAMRVCYTILYVYHKSMKTPASFDTDYP